MVGVGFQLAWGARADPDISERGGALNSLKNNTIFTEKKSVPLGRPPNPSLGRNFKGESVGRGN